MKRNYRVATIVFSPRKAYVANDTDEPSTGNKNIETSLPNSVQFGEKMIVVFQVPHLAFGLAVLFKRPIRWRCENQMNRIRFEPSQFSGVTQDGAVQCRYLANHAIEFRKAFCVFCQLGNRRLEIPQVVGPSGQKAVK
jgi:hypothetical protein